jgi:hypothetical protein
VTQINEPGTKSKDGSLVPRKESNKNSSKPVDEKSGKNTLKHKKEK